MSLKDAVAPELPYLRRYARAFTGSQAMGDAAVRETLEALLVAPGEFDMSAPPRRELYRIFHKLWNPEAIGQLSTATPTAQLKPRARQALLLTSVEGFTPEEAAIVLGCSDDEIGDQLAQAREAISQMLMSDVMIIEDEAIIALHIKSIVRDVGHNVVGVARTHNEAVALARQTSPELVLADISLADGSSGVDAVKDILAEIDVPVIFVTAFPERLLTGERPEPTYLITKPFDPSVLTTTMAQALLFHREERAQKQEQAA